MPHLDELHANLQAKLDKQIVDPCYVEVIIDPDGVNIDISSYVKRGTALTISKKKSIRPYSKLGSYSVSEVNITCNNIADFFNHNVKGKTFYHATTRLFQDASSANSYFDVPAGDGDKLVSGDSVFITDLSTGTTVEKTIDSIDTTTYTYYDRIATTAALGTDFDAGARAETLYLVGKEVIVKSYFDLVTQKVNQFVGVLAALPKLNNTEARLTIVDNFSKLLNIDITANSYKTLIDSLGTYSDNLIITRAEDPASEGLFNLDEVTINTGYCKIGDWKIEFIDESQNYTVTDPDGIEYTGGTLGDFTVGTSPTHQLIIADGCWGASNDYDKGDIIEFKTTCAMGLGVNTYNSVPQMLYRLLIEDFGAGLDTGDLATTPWADIIDQFEACRGAITFTKATTVLKAIETLQAHINASVFHNNDGEISIAAYRPQLESGSEYTLSPNADISELDQEDLGRIQRIRLNYNYTQEGGYQNKQILPDGAFQVGTFMELNYPAYHTSDRPQTRSSGSRIFRMWERGLKAYEIQEKWNTGIAFDINETYKISSNHPALAERLVEIYEIKKDINNKTVTFSAYDRDFVFGNYAFTEVDYTDRGKVTW